MHQIRLYVFAILLISPFPELLNAQTRIAKEVPDSVQVDKGIEYAHYGDRVLKLDLYRPININSTLPVIVLVVGGGYDSVSTDATLIEGVAMAKRGLAAVAIEYRGPAELQFPATVQDVKAAVRWAKANAQNYGFNSEAVGVMGGSFGGQLATYVAVTAGIEELEGTGGNEEFSSSVYAAVGFSSLTDLTELPRNTKGIVKDSLGGWDIFHRRKWRFASAITHVTANSPPLMLVAGGMDRGVPASQSISMARAYEDAGAEVELEVIADAIHPFWAFEPWHDPVMDAAAEFFIRHAAPQKSCITKRSKAALVS